LDLVNTKEKIIEASRKYFNKEGFGASSLNQLANAIGMSRGNLTYHFADKQLIFEAQLKIFREKYDKVLSASVRIPSWKSLNDATQGVLKLKQAYRFIFHDSNSMQDDRVKTLVRDMRDNSVKIQMNMIGLSQQIGNMKPEPFPGTYLNISVAFWMTSFHWDTMIDIMDEAGLHWESLFWSMLLPYFTDKGLASFKNYFGDEYYKSLGTAHEDYVGAELSF